MRVKSDRIRTRMDPSSGEAWNRGKEGLWPPLPPLASLLPLLPPPIFRRDLMELQWRQSTVGGAPAPPTPWLPPPLVWHPGLRFNRIDKDTHTNKLQLFFSGSPSLKNSKVKRAWLGAATDRQVLPGCAWVRTKCAGKTYVGLWGYSWGPRELTGVGRSGLGEAGHYN
jgi:hypothetical protein